MPRTLMALLSSLLLGTSCLAAGPTFDAASVKVSPSDARPPYVNTGGPGTNDPGRYRASHVIMSTLLARAFDVGGDQIKGPAWLMDFSSMTYYDVIATMPPETTKEQFQKMLQNLLAQRFHLAFHTEDRNFAGYDLVVDKGGPKFKEVIPDPNVVVDAARASGSSMSFGANTFRDFPDNPGPGTMSQMVGGVQRTRYQERSMAEFVSNLGYVIGSSMGKPVTQGYPQPRVVDKTGLAGKYTFILEYSTEAGQAMSLQMAGLGRDAATAPPATASDPGGGAPNIIVAIQKQLGLRLDKTADIPLPVIIVDKLDKTPTEN